MMTRPEVTVFLALSLDGFIAGEAHSLDWLTPYSSDPPDETGFNALMEHSDTLLMGRNTYDAVMGFGVWPYDGLRVRVMTHNPVEPRYQEQFVSGELRQVLAGLWDQGARHVYLDGGNLVRQALQADLVDTLTLSSVPVLLGKGIPLFGADIPVSHWHPTQVKTLPSGIVQVSYQRKQKG
ncbi:TPA: dihydrofolate reductase family protein [Aeromonas salmonicida subsp. pectinolytica]